jgi:hypothetical protein
MSESPLSRLGARALVKPQKGVGKTQTMMHSSSLLMGFMLEHDLVR